MKKATSARKKKAANGEPLAWIFDVALKHKDKESCLTWPFGRNSDGYGVIRYKGTMTVAHLVINRKYRGRPKPGNVTRHLCGNGHEGCINPHHLKWGTPKQNSADIKKHGTLVINYGEAHGRALLTDTKVIKILKLIAKGAKTAVLAKRYGVAYTTISNIKQGTNWKHIERVPS